VVRQKDTFAKIMQVHPYSSMLKDASVAIIVCGNKDRVIIKGTDYWVQDCSASVENILIQVADIGLGAVWLGVYPREDRVNGIINLFDLPSHIVPLAIVSIGYPAEEIKPIDRFDKDRIHFEKW
jgi:nitroreductase